MKKFKNFILEGNMDTSDFEFKTNLSNSEISYTNNDDKYDDYEDFKAIIYWKLIFDWMGDEGVDYSVKVDKVALEFTAITFNDNEDIKEEKTLIIDDYDKIIINDITPGWQIMPQEIVVDIDIVEVEF